MTQKVIDNIAVFTSPKLMMQAIDDNFDELYAADAAKVSNVTTDLTVSQTSTTVTVNSSDGTDAVLPTATTSLAGVMSAAMVTKLNTASASASYTAPWV